MGGLLEKELFMQKTERYMDGKVEGSIEGRGNQHIQRPGSDRQQGIFKHLKAVWYGWRVRQGGKEEVLRDKSQILENFLSHRKALVGSFIHFIHSFIVTAVYCLM